MRPVLRSASITQVKQGEVAEQVVPGTAHRIQTASAVASAIGTLFDVQVKAGVTIITVVEGAVLVTTPHGSVVVTSGEQVRVRKGKAPGKPSAVDAQAATAWTDPIPPPGQPIGLNIALAANGGSVYAGSSQRGDPGHAFDPQNANDGRLDRGWQSAPGQISNQWLRVRFQGSQPYVITAIILDCAATGGQDGGNALKDFSVEASDSPDAGFKTVLTGACQPQPGFQVFPLSSPVTAGFVQLSARDNQGGKDGIAVAELGVVSDRRPDVLGTPTPGPTGLQTASATPTLTPTATATGTGAPADTPTPAPTQRPGLSSAVLSPTGVPDCRTLTALVPLCGYQGSTFSYICDLRLAQSGRAACAGVFTAPQCAPPPGVNVTALPYNCTPVLAGDAQGSYSLYVFAVEAGGTNSGWSSDPGHFGLSGSGATGPAVGAVPPGVSGPYTQPLMPTNLGTGQAAVGWIRFTIHQGGSYSMHWTGPGGDVTLGTLNVS